MSESISKFRIFLASPSDLSEERESINDVISELNITFGNPNSIIIDLLKWETNSAPAISEQGVQTIVNKDIGEYDLFIGLLWMKFGTPTQEYGSGTEEEFNFAYQKFKKNKKSVQILFYFKNSLPESLEDINPEELLKVRNFKSSLGDKNVFYWEFSKKGELERFLRIHIPKRITDLKNSSSFPINNLEKKNEGLDIENINIEEELGILDYQEFIEESFSNSTHALEKILEATAWVGEEINKKTAEINKLVAKNNNQPIGFKVQRNLFERTADIMNDFANRLEPEIPIYINNFEKGIDSFLKLATIYKSDWDNKQDEINEANSSLESLLVQIALGTASMEGFLKTVETLPKMSKELNNARRNVATKLKELINKLEISHSIANEVHKQISS